MQLAVPPVKERVLVLRHATLDAEVFRKGLERWDESLGGQLSHQSPPKTEWHIEIPARADGVPEIDNISVKCNVTHQYWNATGNVSKCCVQMRPDFVAFNLVSGKDDVGSFAVMADFAAKHLPLWQDAVGIREFSEIRLQYLNVFGPSHLEPFTGDHKITVGKVVKIFISAPFKDASFIVPYRHEFSLDWHDRDVPCLLDVALSLPTKNQTELDLNITARTVGSKCKMAGEVCLGEVIPAFHNYVLEVFNAILTDEALKHCGVIK